MDGGAQCRVAGCFEVMLRSRLSEGTELKLSDTAALWLPLLGVAGTTPSSTSDPASQQLALSETRPFPGSCQTSAGLVDASTSYVSLEYTHSLAAFVRGI